MIVIAILAIPFIFYFNKTDLGAARQVDLGRIYNRTITLSEFTKNARLMNLGRALGLDVSNELMINNVPNENEMYAEFTWNRLTLRHEADQLGIRPNSKEITSFVKELPRFKGDAGFDVKKYAEFTEEILPSFGLNEAQIEEIVSDQIAMDRVKDLLSGAVKISDAETAEQYQRAYGKMDVSVVRFANDEFDKDINISDDDISKYYEAHKAELKSEEKRKVEFVTFALTDDEKKLTGKERVETLQKVADRANDFTQALLEKGANFGEVATRFQTPVVATEEFTLAVPDPKLKENPQLGQASFQLSEQTPFSDPVQLQNGFSILHLLGATESHPLTLEEAKPKIVETLKAERLREMVSQKAAVVAQQMRDALKSGKPLEEVAHSNGLKLERIPTFALVEPSPTPAEKKDKGKGETTAEELKGKDVALADVAQANVATAETATAATPAVTPAEATPKDPKKIAKTKNPKATETKPKEEKPLEAKPTDAETALLKKKNEPPGFQAIKNATSMMSPGDVSDFIPVEKGGMIAVLDKRAPADPAGFEVAKSEYEKQVLEQSRVRAFIEWLRDRRKAAGVVVGTG